MELILMAVIAALIAVLLPLWLFRKPKTKHR